MATSASHPQGCLDDATMVAFIDDQLSEAQRAAVNLHVDGCSVCLALVAAIGRGQPNGEAGTNAGREETRDSDPAAGTALSPGARVGRYEILRWLGRGGMGTVYAAHDPELDREVALKLLHGSLAEEQSRLLREAQAMAQLAHPNVAAIHDVGRVETQVFVALELIDGPTLGAWMDAGPHPRAKVLDVLVQAGRGLVAAHEAGIVHRDFKPDNVMLGSDGRARVLDFGLARGRSPVGTPGLEDRSAWMTTITVDGAVVGTPNYMSPEQYRGEPADERSDQFSFCVVLHEALLGQRPFVGRSFDELSEAVRSGRLHEPVPASRFRVPNAVRRAIRRGLSVEPTQRWPSMLALLSALEGASRRRRWGWGLGGVVVASAGAGGWAWIDQQAQVTACATDGNAVSGTWKRERPAVEAALGRSEGLASDTAQRVVDELDAYAEHWSEIRTRQCEAARIHETLSKEMWSRTVDCLDDRRRSFDAVSSVLGEVDPQAAPRALEVVAGLDSIDSCLDESGLLRRLDLPEDPEQRAMVGSLRAELAQADVLATTARFDRGAKIAASVLARAQELGYAPLVVEAMYWTGAFRARGDDGSADLTLLENAAERAGEIGHDRIAALAAMELLVAHTERTSFEVAEVWGRFGRMEVARLDDAQTPELAVFVQTRLAVLARARGDYDAAHDELAIAYERAQALAADNPRLLAVVLGGQGELALERSHNAKGRDLLREALDILLGELGPDHPEVGVVEETLALAHIRLGELDAADALIEDALRVHRITSGSEHPLYARGLNNQGTLRVKQRRWEEARVVLEEAVAISTRASGPDASETAKYQKSLALASVGLGDYQTALELDRQVLRVLLAQLGPKHPVVAGAHTGIGVVLRRLGRTEEAREHYTRALEILDEAFPEGERRTANVLNNLGVLAKFEGEFAQVERMHRRALEIRTRIYPEAHVMIVVSRLRLGEALCELGRCEEGQPLLEQGLAAEVETLTPNIRAQGMFALARALQASDATRSSALIKSARTIDPELASELDAWLAARPAG